MKTPSSGSFATEVSPEPQSNSPSKSPAAPSSDATAQSVRRVHAYVIALLVVVTLSVFSVVLQAGFVHWDDGVNIFENPHIRGVSAQSLRWMFTDTSYIPRYMPLGWLSLAVDYDLAGRFNPATYHAGNLLLHCLNTLLVFFLLKKLLTLSARAMGREVDPMALACAGGIGALFWAVHPLRAEPIAWASARIYCTASFLAFVSAAAYLRSVTSESGRGWFWLSVIAFLASLLTYPIALGFVPVLIVLDFYPLRKLAFNRAGLLGAEARKVWLQKLPFITAALLVVVVTAWARTHSAKWIPPVSLGDFGVLARAMQAFYVWASYLWKTCAPFELAPMYPTLVSFNPWSWTFILSAVAIAGLSAVVWINARRWRGLAAIWICYLVLLVPMLGLTEHPHHANDRYSYIPAVLLSLMLASLVLAAWPERQRKLVLVLSAAMLMMAGAMSFRQASHWRNRETLLTHITSQMGDHPLRASQDVLLGFVYRDRQEDEKAAYYFFHALQADPASADAHTALADLWSDHKNYEKALAHYRESLRLKPDQVSTRQNYGIALASAGKLDEAVENFNQLLRTQPKNANANHNLALTLAKLGRMDEAKAHLEEARRLRGQ
ncbi:MAG TPA: tetratricopeptide repeat protein [Verrucomicrobiae bacterium]|jgi:Tfp pilus assembly protein PilF